MKKRSIFFYPLIVILLLISIYGELPSQSLFRIREGDRWGYINQSGKIIIRPIYKTEGEFSNGLAPVRLNGYFGYIDSTGKYAIDPQFDYALSFKNRFAVVYIKGSANFINTTGKKLLNFKCSKLESFENGRAIVYTDNGKAGVIDTNGTLIIDTVFSSITSFTEGLSVVKGFKWFQHDTECGIIDSTGNFVVPFGLYTRISNFLNGFAKVHWYSDEPYAYPSFGFVDRTGKLIFSIKNALGYEASDYVSPDSLFILDYYEHGDEGKKKWTGDKIYSGLMNLKGELVKEDRKSEVKYLFMDSSIYIGDSANRYSLSDINGNPTGQKCFWGIHGFKSCFSIMNSARKWGVVDTNFKFVIQPFFDNIHYMEIMNDFFFYGMNVKDKKGNLANKWGVCCTSGKIISKPEFDDVAWYGFVNGLLKVIKNNRYAYVDLKGNYIWISKKAKKQSLKNLDIDYQLETGYTVMGNWNWPAIAEDTITRQSKKFPDEKFSLILEDGEHYTFNNKYEGIGLYVVNNTGNFVVVPSIDNALYLTFQALDSENNWKNIEIHQRSSCGNSYYNIKLTPRHFWLFAAPVYCGELKTKIRAELIIKSADGNDTKIYSNEINASINPAQFWRKLPFVNSFDIFEKDLK